MVERMNSNIRYGLTKSSLHDAKTLDTYLPQVLMGIRVTRSSRIGYSPYFVLFGIEPNLPTDYETEVPTNLEIRELEIDSLPGVRLDIKRDSKSSSTIPIFEEGSFVMVLNPLLRKRKTVSKFSPRYMGPYVITRILPHNIYELTSEKYKSLTVHVSRIVNFVSRSTRGIPFERGRVEEITDLSRL
ncbi:hypothetical protein AYI69_g10614 [Smittium culicis]|uniref:Uncharacterized protein n=1 Tax=Smittium culicis TaxID=133412 RepID=A0A1R1X4H3_9FUNG|nr:hypothetical protein AYI69_g10614 [Smittium culicis]